MVTLKSYLSRCIEIKIGYLLPLNQMWFRALLCILRGAGPYPPWEEG
jgi:hypothetical protein